MKTLNFKTTVCTALCLSLGITAGLAQSTTASNALTGTFNLSFMPIQFLGSSNNYDVVLKSNNTERIRINAGTGTAAGNVGIGAQALSAKLEVFSTSSLRFYANDYGDIQSTTSMRPHFAGGTDFSIYEGVPGNSAMRMSISGTTGATAFNCSTTSGSAFAVVNTALTATQPWSQILFQVTATGQTYIGTQRQVSPGHTSAMLEVSGDVVVGNGSAANVFVTQTNWADFVFDKNYKLMPLGELEAFYQENHHLPAVPTTQDIQNNGNNLGQTDAVLLQKIEELTLYIVQQQKEIDALKKKMESGK